MKESGFYSIGFHELVFCFLLLNLFALPNLKGQDKKAPLSWKQCLEQDKEWYSSAEAIRVADNLLAYQHISGGWPKNIDMARPLSKEEVEEIIKAKNETGTELSRATLDNGATFPQMRFLARVFEHTKQERFKEAFLKGIRYLLDAQYENGGWPQFFPIRKGYYEHITFNDDVMVNTMQLLKEIFLNQEAFASLQLSDKIKDKAQKAFEKGVRCILRTQIYINGQPTVWCAQHDKNTLAPAKARSYELPSFSGSESVGIVLLLMDIEDPSDDIIAAVNGAISWFEKHKIEGIRLERILNKEGQKDLILVKDPNAKPLWGRFYDLQTGKPFFCSRDGIKRKSLAEISYNRRNGYKWYTDAPEKALKKYAEWKKNYLTKKQINRKSS